MCKYFLSIILLLSICFAFGQTVNNKQQKPEASQITYELYQLIGKPFFRGGSGQIYRQEYGKQTSTSLPFDDTVYLLTKIVANPDYKRENTYFVCSIVYRDCESEFLAELEANGNKFYSYINIGESAPHGFINEETKKNEEEKGAYKRGEEILKLTEEAKNKRLLKADITFNTHFALANEVSRNFERFNELYSGKKIIIKTFLIFNIRKNSIYSKNSFVDVLKNSFLFTTYSTSDRWFISASGDFLSDYKDYDTYETISLSCFYDTSEYDNHRIENNEGLISSVSFLNIKLSDCEAIKSKRKSSNPQK